MELEKQTLSKLPGSHRSIVYCAHTCLYSCRGDSRRPGSCSERGSDAVLGVMEASSDAHGVRDVGSQSLNGVLSERVVGADKDWLLPAFTIVYLILGHRGKRGKVVGLHMKHHKTDLRTTWKVI